MGCNVKSVFPEWYDGGSPDDRDAHATGFVSNPNATVAFDASALLQLYRLDPVERSEVLSAINALSDRLFVPHQAGLEYQRGRERAIENQQALFDAASSSFERWRKATAGGFASSAIEKRIRAASENASAKLRKLVDELQAEYALTATNDDVRDALDALLTPDRLGTEPTAAQKLDRASEYERRAPLEIPPGYLDLHKGAPGMYGDYFIWSELLDRARATKRPLLLVTNDEKGDWSNKNRTPRRELVQEMDAVADVVYHHINLKTFLRLAKKHLSIDIADETIDSVQEGSQFSDEEAAEILAAADITGVWASLYRDMRNPIAEQLAEIQRTTGNPIAEQLAAIQRDMRNPIADAQRRVMRAESTEIGSASEASGDGIGDDESPEDVSPDRTDGE